jgi:hypothetical protein
MREIDLGGKIVRVRATPLALLYYRQEFKSDLLGDFAKLKDLVKEERQEDGTVKQELNIDGFDYIFFLRITWAMAKADSYGGNEKFAGFEAWLASLGQIDFGDINFLSAVMEEAADGFLAGRKIEVGEGIKASIGTIGSGVIGNRQTRRSKLG